MGWLSSWFLGSEWKVNLLMTGSRPKEKSLLDLQQDFGKRV